MKYLSQEVTTGPGTKVVVQSNVNDHIRASLLDLHNYWKYQSHEGFYYEDMGEALTNAEGITKVVLRASSYGRWWLVVDSNDRVRSVSADYTVVKGLCLRSEPVLTQK